MMSEHWPRGTLVTRLYERDSLALSLTRSSGETRAHRSRTTLRFVYVGLRPRSGSARTTLAPPSERPDGRWISAFLTVRRLLYSNDSLAHHSFSLDSSVECLTQRRREAESAENARNLANTMSYASNLLEAKHHLKGETTNCSGHCDKTTNLQFSQHSLPLCASA